MQQKIYSIFYLFLFYITGFSQNTINGKITDQNKNNLAGSHIHVGSKTVLADRSGNFIVRGLPSGKTTIYISYVGYESIDTTIILNSDVSLAFVLKRGTAKLKEVVLKQKANTENSSILERKIKTATIEKYSNQTLGDALKEIAGVSLLKTGSNIVKPIINGLHSSRVPIINNNVRLEDQQWGSEHAPNFDLNSAGKITVIKGASGLQYGGDAIGGLVILEPISVKKDTLFGKTIVNLASNGRGGSLSSSIHKGNFCDWSWNILTTFKYLGDREAPDYVLSNSGNKEINFSGDVKFIGKNYDVAAFYSVYNARIAILSASHIGNVNDLYNAINNQVPYVVEDFTYDLKNPKQEVHHHLAKINYNYYWNESSSLGIQYAFQFNKRLEFDLRRGDNSNKAALDLELITNTLNLDYKKTFNDWNIKSGISASYQDNYADPSTDIRPLIPTYKKTDAGIYGVLNYNFSESLILESGVRYDFSKMDARKYYLKSRWDERNYSPEFSEFIVGEDGNQWLTKPRFVFDNFSGSAGLHKEFSDDWNWYINTSLATRNPNPSELFSDGLHHATGVIELGDLRLKKEQSIQFSTTVQKKWSTFSIEINPYINKINSYVYLKPIAFETTIRGAFPVWEYQQTTALLTGLDLQTQWYIGKHWQHFFSLATVNGFDLTQDLPLIDMPPITFNNKIQFTKKEWNDFLLEIKHEVVFTQTQFPDNNFVTNIVGENAQTIPVIIDISKPPSGFNLLDFYSEMKFNSFKKGSLTVAFSVQNVLNTNYREYLNRQRFFVDEMGRNLQIQLKINY